MEEQDTKLDFEDTIDTDDDTEKSFWYNNNHNEFEAIDYDTKDGVECDLFYTERKKRHSRETETESKGRDPWSKTCKNKILKSFHECDIFLSHQSRKLCLILELVLQASSRTREWIRETYESSLFVDSP